MLCDHDSYKEHNFLIPSAKFNYSKLLIKYNAPVYLIVLCYPRNLVCYVHVIMALSELACTKNLAEGFQQLQCFPELIAFLLLDRTGDCTQSMGSSDAATCSRICHYELHKRS
uniref:Uncharacterized protein n=1 Tax=Setaria viridis TaxID=4556 RepID=A0A4U6VGU2_SETVI|nr:hypothetical protein SEVIR_3G351800v2 [Setaria viridis]